LILVKISIWLLRIARNSSGGKDNRVYTFSFTAATPDPSCPQDMLPCHEAVQLINAPHNVPYCLLIIEKGPYATYECQPAFMFYSIAHEKIYYLESAKGRGKTAASCKLRPIPAGLFRNSYSLFA
jgi:hypothetical protein